MDISAHSQWTANKLVVAFVPIFGRDEKRPHLAATRKHLSTTRRAAWGKTSFPWALIQEQHDDFINVQLYTRRPYVVFDRPPLWSRLMCTSEWRGEKQEGPSVQDIPDRDGEGGGGGASVPPSLSCSVRLYSTELQTVFVIKRCLLLSVRMFLSLLKHKLMNLFKSCLHAIELEKTFPKCLRRAGFQSRWASRFGSSCLHTEYTGRQLTEA